MTLHKSSTKHTVHIPQNIAIARMQKAMPMSNLNVMEYIAIACMLCGVEELTNRIRVAWSGRFTARMGDARWFPRLGLGCIRLSLPLWPKATHDEQVEIITHEASHVIADYKFGGRQMHGPRWRQMMRLCGYQNPRRCHTVNIDEIHARRRRRRLAAVCGCPNGILISPIIARRLLAGAAYRCRACRQSLTLLQPVFPIASDARAI